MAMDGKGLKAPCAAVGREGKEVKGAQSTEPGRPVRTVGGPCWVVVGN